MFRKEVPAEDWVTGRRVLQHFLEREQIYQTPALHQALEASARNNLRRELSAL